MNTTETAKMYVRFENNLPQHSFRMNGPNRKLMAYVNFAGDVTESDMVRIMCLMEAVPDLLEACKRAELWVDQMRSIPGCRAAADCMLNILRPAIAKAEKGA